MTQCTCNECFTTDKRGKRMRIIISPPQGISHNCSYVQLRNTLIPQAEAFANECCLDTKSHTRDGVKLPCRDLRWTRYFADEMERLWRALQATMAAMHPQPTPPEPLVGDTGVNRLTDIHTNTRPFDALDMDLRRRYRG